MRVIWFLFLLALYSVGGNSTETKTVSQTEACTLSGIGSAKLQACKLAQRYQLPSEALLSGLTDPSGSLDAAGQAHDVAVVPVRNGKQSGVPVSLLLRPDQRQGLAFLQVVSKLRSAAHDGQKAMHGTIYEVIIQPIKNVLAYITPRLAFLLSREILCDLFNNILALIMLQVLSIPPIAQIDPAAVPPALQQMPLSALPPLPPLPPIKELLAPLPKELTEPLPSLLQVGSNPSVDSATVDSLASNETLLLLALEELEGGGRNRKARDLGMDSPGGVSGSSDGEIRAAEKSIQEELASLALAAGEDGAADAMEHLGLDEVGGGTEGEEGEEGVGWAEGSSSQHSDILRSKFLRDLGGMGMTQLHAGAGASSSGGGRSGAGARGSQPGRAKEGDAGITGTAAQISLVVTPTVVEAALPRLRRVITERLVPKAAAGVQRALMRVMVPRITQQLVRAVVANMTVQLLSRGGLADTLTTRVRDAVVPRLSRQLTLAIVRSLTARPAAAHFCQLCAGEGLYCDECRLDKERGRQVDARSEEAVRFWGWRLGRSTQQAVEELGDREGTLRAAKEASARDAGDGQGEEGESGG